MAQPAQLLKGHPQNCVDSPAKQGGQGSSMLWAMIDVQPATVSKKIDMNMRQWRCNAERPTRELPEDFGNGYDWCDNIG